MKYGEELKQIIIDEKERMISALERREERIRNWETDEDDCFLSIKVEQQTIQECNMKLRILNTDGLMDYEAVFDEDDQEVRVKWVNTKYGTRIVGRGIFANSMSALLKKTGWHTKMIRVPVWVSFSSNGSGLYGAYTGSYQEVRWHTNMVTGEYVGYPE